MGKLKLCFMVHVEDGTGFDADGNALSIGSLARVAWGGGTRGGKVSILMGSSFAWDLDDGGTYPLAGAPTSLQWVLSCSGNFWMHGHRSDEPGLETLYAGVRSLYTGEKIAGGPAAEDHVIGRSGLAGIGVDWVSIIQGLPTGGKLRHVNSTAVIMDGMVPQSLRPYGLDDDDLVDFYNHAPAPGPFHEDLMTMRMRPFWAETSSFWSLKGDLATIEPSSLFVSSIMVIPQPGRWKLSGYADRHQGTDSDSKDLTVADLDAAFTEINTACHIAQNVQPDICNVWYTNLPLAAFNDDDVALGRIGDFVDSIKVAYVDTAKAEWKNMNEIVSIFTAYGS